MDLRLKKIESLTTVSVSYSTFKNLLSRCNVCVRISVCQKLSPKEKRLTIISFEKS